MAEDTPSTRAATYTHGHHESVLAVHRWRTVENSAGYLLSELSPGLRLLDVGCGPGTITAGLSERVQPGEVIGIDPAETVIDEARQLEGRHANLHFATGNVYELEYADSSFDVVHAHQVLQHLAEPVQALSEMRRVTKPGGLVAVRDADYGAFVWYPESDGLESWRELYRRVARQNGGEPDAGRKLLSWANAVGFTEVRPSASTWCFANQADRDFWGGQWAERVLHSGLADRALAAELIDRPGLESMAQAWRGWASAADGWFVVIHAEVLCRK